MPDDRFPSWARALLALTIAGAITACSGEDIVFPGDDDDDDEATVTVTGNIDDVSPVSTRDIVVFVYHVDDDTDRGVCTIGGVANGESCGEDLACVVGTCDAGRCPCPAFPGDTSEGKAAVIESGETEFSVSGLANGAIKVVFLLDNPGDDADGQIDDGDPIAILDDEDCEIDDLDGGLTVTLTEVDIDFSPAPVSQCQGDDPPASGRARADRITQERTGESGDSRDD
jgi:hypothetical protein